MGQDSRPATPAGGGGALKRRGSTILPLTAVFGAALAVRVVYLVQAPAHPLHGFVFALSDSLHYHRSAVAIAGGEFAGEVPFFLGPLYAYALGLLYACFGPSIGAVYAFQAVLGAATCALLAAAGRRLFDARVGWISGLALAVYAPHVYYTGHLLPTVLVVFLNVLLLWILVRDASRPRAMRAAAAGIVLGLAVLAKSNALLLLLAVPVVFAWTGRGLSARRRAAWCASFVLAALITIAPATLHNFAASERFVPVTTSTGRNLWKGNGPFANGTHPLGDWEGGGAGLGPRLQGGVDAGEAVEESSRYAARTWDHVRSEPGATLQLAALKLALFLNAVELGVRDQYYFSKEQIPLLRGPLLGFGVIAPLGIVGMLACWRRRRDLWPAYALLVCQVVSFVGVFVLARYRLVAVACLVPFAAERGVAWWDAARAGRLARAVPSLAAAALIALAVNVPLASYPKERGFALQWEKIGDRHRLEGRPAAALAAFDKALASDADGWQGLDPETKRGETLLRMARARWDLGDRAGALRVLDELLAELHVSDARSRRLDRDARTFRAELSPGS